MMVTAMRNRPHLLVVAAASVALAGVAAVVGFVPWRNAEKVEAAPAKAPEAVPRRAGSATSCANCGTVEMIRSVVVPNGTDGSKRTVYRITVRMDDGSFRTLSQVLPPSVAVGETVRITDGAVVRPPAPDDAKG
jgi:hypothetical protein